MKCPHCHNGKVVLLTTVKTCDKCGGASQVQAYKWYDPASDKDQSALASCSPVASFDCDILTEGDNGTTYRIREARSGGSDTPEAAFDKAFQEAPLIGSARPRLPLPSDFWEKLRKLPPIRYVSTGDDSSEFRRKWPSMIDL
jgi:hypothetical protein